MVYPEPEEEPEGIEYQKQPRPLDYIIPDEEIDPNAPPADEEDTDYFRQKVGLEQPEGAYPGQSGVQPGVSEQEAVQEETAVSFYYPTSGGQVQLAVGDTRIDFTEGTVSLPGGGSDTLSSRLTGTKFSGIRALYIVADKSFEININGVAKMSVQKNFKKRHINIQRIVLSVSSSTNFLIWASTDPDADFEKDINEVTVAGGVSPLGGITTADSADLDVNTWTTIASRTIDKGTTFRLTKTQVQCGSAAWGCVLMGGATVAVFRIPDDGYFVDWYPYGDAVKLLGDGIKTVDIKAKSKSSPVTALGVFMGEEST